MKAMLGFDEMREVLGKYGFPMLEEGLAKTEDEAVKIADKIGFPVVLKSVSPDINHRTHVNTILNSAEEVRQEYRKILKNASGHLDGVSGVNIPGILVQRHSAHGMEAIVGMTRDPQLGPIVSFGLSGVFAFLKDISYRVAPVSKEEALKMIKEIKAYSIIKGDGKKRPGDIGAIADVIEKVSRLSMENDNISEIDIDPLVVYERGAVVIGARVVMG